jgi:SSS family solute:Na+ symporter
VPVLLGIIARSEFPALPATNLALPTLMTESLPPLVGGVALAAVFSAEVSAADASLFMLTTSLTQDLYKRFVNPTATDHRLLAIARFATVVSGSLGVVIAVLSDDVSRTLTVPYTLIGVSLFVPILAGLHTHRTKAGALVAILAGVAGMLTSSSVPVERAGGRDTALAGLAAAALAWLVSLIA